jgi:hypothetical protein
VEYNWRDRLGGRESLKWNPKQVSIHIPIYKYNNNNNNNSIFKSLLQFSFTQLVTPNLTMGIEVNNNINNNRM